ncbi:MAG: hypothetical protein COT74_05915 [Bdellovibrionales bacterium CG10_big_fil_rev_8_21_14_0_10_45_34]|nr:MAG: hypothetical protein COT74_05915 [Bdellovibrionales bacterium CG10_big_fil_rev_8_21_14_0_10_45_34]
MVSFESDILKIFFLSSFDADRTVTFAKRCLSQVRRETKNSVSNEEAVVIASPIIVKYWFLLRKSLDRHHRMSYPKAGFEFPEKIDFGPWREFLLKARDEEILAVLFLLVLKWPSAAVSEGLNASLGSLHTRVSRGLEWLIKVSDFASQPDFQRGPT